MRLRVAKMPLERRKEGTRSLHLVAKEMQVVKGCVLGESHHNSSKLLLVTSVSPQ
jgi:hypothetical protein